MLRVPMPVLGSLSRETRLLAATIAVSVLVLLVLGRFRFPEASDVRSDPTRTQPLARLASRAAFDDLSLSVSQLSSRVGASLIVLRVSLPPIAADAGAPAPATVFVPAIRVRDDVVLTSLPAGAQVEGAVGAPGAVSLIAADAVRGLALVRVPSQPVQVLAMREGYAPLSAPSYMAVAAASRSGTALQPLFVGRSDIQPDPRWDAPLLTLGPGVNAAPGSPVFSLDGRLAGLATTTDGEVALIPAEALMVSVERMFNGTTAPTGHLGISTQALNARIARATSATAGAVVAAVSPEGPADGRLWVGDIITAANGQPISGPEALALRAGRTPPGTTITLTVLRRATYQSVPIVVAASPATGRQADRPVARRTEVELGLTLRLVKESGAEVVRVRADGAADHAGLRAGDLVRVIGQVRSPAPAQVTQAWDALPTGGTLFLGISREGAPQVVVLEK